jgi:hypothetical protein
VVEAKSQIAFEQLGLGSVLRQYRLKVPPNQREYAWTDREVEALFRDFAKAINAEGAYFLGTIVTIPRADDTLEVVDGQQRLATTAILLAAIRDYLSDKHEAVLVESINNEFLTGIDRTKRTRVAKLTLNVDDNELFNQIVAGDATNLAAATRTSHKRMLYARTEALKHVKRVVAALDPKEHGDLLNDWVSFIDHRALIVLLKVPNDADAYRMFETLNDRGLRTSQVDLIKNHLFSKAGDRFNEVQKRWSYMRGTLESLEETNITVNFLRHALIVQRGYLREADVYVHVQDVARSEQPAATFSATLENLATVYVATFNPEHERWNTYPDAARRAIEVFNLLKIGPMRPLILAVGHRMDKNEASVCFQFLISLGVRLQVASSTRSGSVEEPLADAAKEVFEGDIDTLAKLRRALAQITPSDRDFREAFELARVSNARLARYYLRSLEMAAKDEAAPWFIPQDDKSIINLEHVLPKKPESNWPTFSDEDAKRYVTRLGNLALLRASDNSDLKSDAFEDKRRIYAASPYVLTAQLADVDSWVPAAIDQRQKQLAQLAVKTWPAKL